MEQIVLVIHVLMCFFMIVLILVQHGKGADIGASFGGGASNTVFGSQGSGSFLMKLTGGFALVFFITSLWLGHMAVYKAKTTNNLGDIPVPTAQVSKQAAAPAVSKTESKQKGSTKQMPKW